MKITLAYLGGSRGYTGCSKETREFPELTTVNDVAEWLRVHHPTLAPWLGSLRFARNFEFVTKDAALSDGDELALLPPVSGGAPQVVITAEPLQVGEVVASVGDPSIGATVVFVGTVRNASEDKAVCQLTYEAYEPMAQRELQRIIDDLEKTGARVSIAHRVGTLGVGDTSIVIAAAAPHRAEAFAACRQAIERIKVDVPIWKQELREEGEVWVSWGGG